MLSALAPGRCYMVIGLTCLISIQSLNSLSCIAVGSYAQVFLCSKGYFYMGFSCRLPVSLTRGEIFKKSSQSVVEIQRVKSYGTSRAASIPLYIP